jgi:hypothetical protein
MTVRNQHQPSETRPQDSQAPEAPPVRKAFVEPRISSPVDVLEATTFFQVVDSGGTGLRPRRGQGDL